IQGVAGNVALAKRTGDLPHLVCRLIAETTLAIAQRPERGQRRVSSQVRIPRQYLARRWTAKDVIDEVSAAGAKPGSLRIIVGKVELDTRRAVEKQAPGLGFG